MAMQDGMRRIVTVLSIAAWAALALAIVLGALFLFGREKELALPVMGIGLVAFGVLQGAAWICAGFLGKPGGEDGLVRFKDLRFGTRAETRPLPPSSSPVGVGGWLWLPIIGLLVVGPLAGISQTAQAISEAEYLYPSILEAPEWANYKTASWLIIAAACVLSVSAGYRLLRDFRPQTVTFAIWALWLRGLGTSLLDAISTQAFLDVSIFDYYGDPQTLRAVFGAIIAATVWTLYFKWSRRVRNTYHHQLYPAVPRVDAGDRSEPTL